MVTRIGLARFFERRSSKADDAGCSRSHIEAVLPKKRINPLKYLQRFVREWFLTHKAEDKGTMPSDTRDTADELWDVAEVKHRYGDFAAQYAQIRKETAEKLGDNSRAQHWQKVEDELKFGP